MQKELTIITKSDTELIDITSQIQQVIKESKVENGTLFVFAPHTTAGITINEHDDPSVVEDILATLEKMAPTSGDYLHTEGNSHAHIKATLVGSSQAVFIKSKKLALGTWQGIFFCEFDGPRNRKVFLKILDG